MSTASDCEITTRFLGDHQFLVIGELMILIDQITSINFQPSADYGNKAIVIGTWECEYVINGDRADALRTYIYGKV